MTRIRKQACGFTLIELLIAMTVFAIMSAMAYGGLNSVLNASEHTRGQAKQLRDLQLAIRLMQRDIELAVDRPVRDFLGDPEDPVRSGGDPLLLLTQAGWPNPGGLTRSNLRRVGYRIEEDILYRLTWNSLDGAEPSDTLRTRVLSNITEIQFRFLNSENDWVGSWPQPVAQGEPTAMPKAIELRMTTKTWGLIRRVFVPPA